MSRLDKVSARLRAQLEGGEFYEAQQGYKAAFYRFKSRDQAPDAHALLLDGTREQLRHDQLTCASELLCLALESFTATDEEVSEARVAATGELISAFASIQGAAPEAIALEVRKVAGMASKWTTGASARKEAAQLMATTARTISKVRGQAGLGEAALYFTISDDMESFAEAVQANAQAGHEHEAHLFRTRAVLQVVSMSSPATKYRQVEAATKLASVLQAQEPVPLDNFIGLLLISLNKLSKPLFDTACSCYADELKRDESFAKLLKKTEGAFFAQGGPGGMPGLLGSLLGGS